MTPNSETIHELRPISAPELAADATGRVIGELARMAYASFREPPWQDDLDLPRLNFGLGVDLMRPGAKAFMARDKKTGEAVGYILGYEVCKKVSLATSLTLRGLSGSHQLDNLCDDGKRVFYCDTLCVVPRHRRESIAENLSKCLNHSLRSEREYSYRLDRTHISAEAPRSLYRKLGFSELPVRDIRFSNRSYWLLRIEFCEVCMEYVTRMK